jgi:hypothetical protein
MTEIYNTDTTFDFDKLVFLKPIAVIGGNYFIRIRLHGAPLYVQPPKCKTKQGIIKTGKKYYTDLMFTNENEDFIQWMESLESKCQTAIYENREKWFTGDMEKHDIENYFTSPLKVYKSGKFYISRANVSSDEQHLRIYDENENVIALESVDDKTEAMTVLEIQGIRCSAKSFQLDIELKQMMTLAPKDIFNKCVFITAKTQMETRSDQIESNQKGGLETSTTPCEVETELELVVAEEPEAEPEPEPEPEAEPEPEPEADAIEPNHQASPGAEQDIEEFNVHLEDLSANETIQLKQRNDVYYEMYKEAKRKAKIARDLALASYLEAKRIKNMYMLEDINDSDESDTEDDPEDLADSVDGFGADPR